MKFAILMLLVAQNARAFTTQKIVQQVTVNHQQPSSNSVKPNGSVELAFGESTKTNGVNLQNKQLAQQASVQKLDSQHQVNKVISSKIQNHNLNHSAVGNALVTKALNSQKPAEKLNVFTGIGQQAPTSPVQINSAVAAGNAISSPIDNKPAQGGQGQDEKAKILVQQAQEVLQKAFNLPDQEKPTAFFTFSYPKQSIVTQSTFESKSGIPIISKTASVVSNGSSLLKSAASKKETKSDTEAQNSNQTDIVQSAMMNPPTVSSHPPGLTIAVNNTVQGNHAQKHTQPAPVTLQKLLPATPSKPLVVTTPPHKELVASSVKQSKKSEVKQESHGYFTRQFKVAGIDVKIHERTDSPISILATIFILLICVFLVIFSIAGLIKFYQFMKSPKKAAAKQSTKRLRNDDEERLLTKAGSK